MTGKWQEIELTDGHGTDILDYSFRKEWRRVDEHQYRVNEVSRKLCGGLMRPREAYRELEKIKDSCQYKRELKALSYAFIAAFFGESVALMGHLFARFFRAPVSVFLVPGILPLVPGTSIYNSVYYVIRNSREESMYYLVETLQIAGAIALAVFLMDSVFKLVGKKKRIKV